MALNLLNQVATVKLKQRLDAQSSLWLSQQVEQLQQDNHSMWVFDMTQVEFLDSQGLVDLVAAYRSASEANAQLVLCSVSRHIQMIFDLAQLDQVFVTVETMEALPILMSDYVSTEQSWLRKAA